MNESCHTYEWVMSHIWMSHVTRMDWDIVCMYTHMNTHMNTHMTSRWHLICDMTHDIVRMYTHMNESCHTYEWVMSHVWLMTSYVCTHTHIWHLIEDGERNITTNVSCILKAASNECVINWSKSPVQILQHNTDCNTLPPKIQISGNLRRCGFGVYEFGSPVSGFQLFICTRPIPGTKGSDLLEIK